VATGPLLAEPLAEDLQEEHTDAWDMDRCLLNAMACEILLSRVDWLQVAERVVEHVAGTPEPIIMAAGDKQDKSQAG
jgi:hypothetical protein